MESKAVFSCCLNSGVASGITFSLFSSSWLTRTMLMFIVSQKLGSKAYMCCIISAYFSVIFVERLDRNLLCVSEITGRLILQRLYIYNSRGPKLMRLRRCRQQTLKNGWLSQSL